MNSNEIEANSEAPAPRPSGFIKELAWTAAAGLAIGGAAFLATRYVVCKPNQFMVRTGLAIRNMNISRKGIVWPFQKSHILDMNPRTYSFDLHNMSKGKVEFKLPVVFTIGPVSPLDNLEAFERYATTMNEMSHQTLTDTIQGIIEGETRGLTADLTVEEMFNAKETFRERVVQKIQKDLHEGFGLRIYNANIREMSDYDANNKYFEFRKQRAIQTANYEAQVDVARAKREGETGMKEQERDTRIMVSEMERHATLKENEQQGFIAQSNAELARIREDARLQEQLARINADNESLKREEEMRKIVEEKRAQRELERMRADDLNLSKIKAERAVVEADGEAESIRRIADAHLYKSQQEAQGILAVLDAQATGLHNLTREADPELVKFYLGLEKNLPQELTRLQAEGLRDMKPAISVWNTGSDANHQNIALPLTNLFQSFAPLMDGMRKNGNIDLSKPFRSSHPE
jgi:flotillin